MEVGQPGVRNAGAARVRRRLDDLFINACIGNHSLPLALFLPYCIHIYASCGWWRGPIPSLGIDWVDAGYDSEYDNNDNGWYD